MSTDRLFVVVGSGPGIGSQTAAKFASQGFNRIALVSRNAERLKSESEYVSKASTNSLQVRTYPTDVGDGQALKATLSKIENELGGPEVVLFNAARIAETSINEPFENIIEDCKIMQVGLYITAAWAVSTLTGSHPSILLSGGSIWAHPSSQHTSLSMQKAAQVNLLGSLAQIVGPKGIHVARIDIGGVVQDSDPEINAANIANNFYQLSQQDKDHWESVRTIGDITKQ